MRDRASLRLEPTDLDNLTAIRDAMRTSPRAGLTVTVTDLLRAALVAGAALAREGRLVEVLTTAAMQPRV